MRSPAVALLLLFPWIAACPLADDDDAAAVPDDDDATGDDDDATGDDDDATGDDDDSTPPAGTIDGLLEALRVADASGADAVLHDVGWTHGWPVREGARRLFATAWSGAANVGFVSDINLWSLGAHPAEVVGGGGHWAVVIDDAELQVPAAGAKYKWYRADGAGEYRAGPEATAYGADEFGPFGYVAPPTDVRWSERFPRLTSAAMPLPRNVRVLLPPGFVATSPAAGRTRALLMHDGQNLWDVGAIGGGWRIRESLDSEEVWDDVVVVAVDNAADRLDVYAHVADDPFEDGSSIGGRSDDYLALLADSVLPFVRARYGLVAQGSSLAMAGSSMGGLVTLQAARTWDSALGCAAALSPTVGWGAYAASADGSAALTRSWADAPGHGSCPVFLYSGGGAGNGCVDTDGDGVVEDSEDSDNYCVTTQLRDALEGLGYAFDVDLWHWWQPLAQHNEAAWAAQVVRFLEACQSAGWLAPAP